MKAQMYKNYHTRAAMTPSSFNEEERSVDGVLTTERPVLVFDYARWEPIQEVLLVDGMIPPQRGKIPFIDAHSRSKADNVIGSTSNFRKVVAEDGVRQILTTNTFSSTEDKLFTKAREGHLDSTSVGYEVFPSDSETIAPGEEREINGQVWKNEHDQYDLVIRKTWRPKENSLLPIGADDRANFRSEIKPQKEEKQTSAEPNPSQLDMRTADNIREYFKLKK